MICGGFAWAYATDTSEWLGDGFGPPEWLGRGHDHAEGYGDGDGWDIGHSFTQVVS